MFGRQHPHRAPSDAAAHASAVPLHLTAASGRPAKHDDERAEWLTMAAEWERMVASFPEADQLGHGL